MTTKVENQFQAPSHVSDSIAAAHIVSPSALDGTWTNVDSATRDIIKVVITTAGGKTTVQTFGACTPSPCNWGSETALVYAASVSSSSGIAFTTSYKFSFANVILTGHLHGKELILESFTHFTDGSGRSDLYTTDTMKK
jgi:hypothetical protein